MSTSPVCLVKGSLTIVTIRNRCPQVALIAIGLLLFLDDNCVRAAGGSATAPPPSPVEQALAQVTSEDEAVREAAMRTLIELGDVSLLPRLEELRANADRTTRQAIKPVMDLLRNRANLSSADPHVRRSAATDLGTMARAVAIAWLEEAARKEPNKWVRYTMEESGALLSLDSDNSSVKVTAAEKLGELRSQNAAPRLKELVAAGNVAEATEEQKSLAKVAEASIERIETWAAWSSAIETIFRGISL